MENIYDLVIIGGGCAGLTAGIYSGRANMKTIILEKQFSGGQAAITNEITNYPGFKKISGYELTKVMLEQAKAFGTEFSQEKAISVDFSKEIKEVHTKNNVIKGYSVIIASGAEPKEAGFKGEKDFKGKGVSYCAYCDGFFFSEKNVFVIGSGYSAAQEALYLSRLAKKVTIVIRKDKLKCPNSIAEKIFKNSKIDIVYNTQITEVFGDNGLKKAILKNNITNENYIYTPQEKEDTFGIFVFTGYKPTTELVKEYIKTDKNGYILTNENMETNIKGIYAAGDIRQKNLRQIVTATSDGAIAASEAEKYIMYCKK